MSIQEKLTGILARELGLDPSEISDDLAYGTTPEWDSVGHMHLISALEEEFDITFDDAAISELTNLPKMRDAVRALTDQESA